MRIIFTKSSNLYLRFLCNQDYLHLREMKFKIFSRTVRTDLWASWFKVLDSYILKSTRRFLKLVPPKSNRDLNFMSLLFSLIRKAFYLLLFLRMFSGRQLTLFAPKPYSSLISHSFLLKVFSSMLWNSKFIVQRSPTPSLLFLTILSIKLLIQIKLIHPEGNVFSVFI